MKRWIAWLAALALLFSCLAAQADTGKDAQAENHLIVGNPTRMMGNFFTDLWGRSTSDIDVRELINGYNLVTWNVGAGIFEYDPSVVSGMAVLENAAGDRSYVFVLYDDLYYSDGTKINAWDYAFSFLFQIAMEVNDLGGVADQKNYLVGYQEYHDGTVPYLAGVRVLTDDTLMLSISHEYLPFFYEMGWLSCMPYPRYVIAPGVTVKDDGQGVYLANEDESIEEPLFTVELLRETVLNEEHGYLYYPSVVCGPYVMKSFDGTTAEFEINPWFKGDKLNRKPSIQYVTYTVADNGDMIEKLQKGEFGLLNKVTNKDTIMQGIQTIGSGTMMSNYPRIGLTYIAFVWERDTVSSQAVRQAIAWCADRDQIMEDYTSGFGLRVDGYYGVGQWMYGIVRGNTPYPYDPPEDENDQEAQAAYEEALAAWDALNIDNLIEYHVDLKRARALLDADGWTLNAEGIREKEIDGETVTLDLKMIYPEGNTIVDSFAEHFVPYLQEVGIRLTMEPVEITKLLAIYYKQEGEPRDMDMIYLGTDFELVFDPSIFFFQQEEGEPDWIFTGRENEELYKLALNMRRTEPGAVLEYMQKWVKFQEAFNRILPALPIYSNIYFDFYTNSLHEYIVQENVTWSHAIVGAYLGDAIVLPGYGEETEEAEFEDSGDYLEIE